MLNVVASPPNVPTATPAALPPLVEVISEPQMVRRVTILLVGGMIVLLLMGAALYLLSRSWS